MSTIYHRAILLSVLLTSSFADTNPNQYLIYNEYGYNGICSGQPQRQIGNRFGACIINGGSSQRYNLTSWTESTSSLAYSISTYPSMDCSGTPTVQNYNIDGSNCNAVADGTSFYRTYAMGRTPWAQAVVGGIVTAYHFFQNGSTACHGPPDLYYAQGYDYCQKLSNDASTGPVACSATTYQDYYYTDGNCAYIDGINTHTKRTCLYDPTNTRWITDYCGLSSENFLASSR